MVQKSKNTKTDFLSIESFQHASIWCGVTAGARYLKQIHRCDATALYQKMALTDII